MADMAIIISCMFLEPASAKVRESEANDLAFWAFSEVARIILVISSNDALVSSTDEACSLAPDDRFWLATDTCLAAAAVCEAP